MKVKELIAKLQECEQEDEVVLIDDEDYLLDINYITPAHDAGTEYIVISNQVLPHYQKIYAPRKVSWDRGG